MLFFFFPEAIPTAEIPDTIPVASSTDWQAAFGFTSASVPAAPPAVAPPSVDSHIDDDLGITVHSLIILVFTEHKIEMSE